MPRSAAWHVARLCARNATQRNLPLCLREPPCTACQRHYPVSCAPSESEDVGANDVVTVDGRGAELAFAPELPERGRGGRGRGKDGGREGRGRGDRREGRWEQRAPREEGGWDRAPRQDRRDGERDRSDRRDRREGERDRWDRRDEEQQQRGGWQQQQQQQQQPAASSR